MPEMDLPGDISATAVVDEVAQAVVAFFTALFVGLGKAQDSPFSVDNLLAIRRYEALAQLLPETEADIRAMLADLGDNPSLDIGRFSKAFTALREHANQWRRLEDAMAGLRKHFAGLANSLEAMAAHLDNLVSKIKAARVDFAALPTRYGELLEHERLLGDQYLASLGVGTIGLVEGKDLKQELDDLFDDVKAFALVIQGVGVLLGDFSVQLQEQVWEKVKTLIHAVESIRPSDWEGKRKGEFEALLARRRQLAERYKALQEEFWRFVTMTASQKAFLFPGQSQAAAKQKHEAKVAELGTEGEKLDAEWKLLDAGVVLDLERFGDLQLVVKELKAISPFLVNADVALGTLRSIWTRFQTLVEACRSDVAQVKDDYSLLLLAARVSAIAGPWGKIRDELAALSSRIDGARSAMDAAAVASKTATP